MSSWPRLSPWPTITGRYWGGVLELHRLEESGFCGAGMPKFRGKNLFPAIFLTNSRKIVLSFPRQNNSDLRTETFGDFPWAKRSKNNFVYYFWS
jgi:hypothetical protein